MIIEKKMSLKSILESNNGIHLTAYLVNRGDLVDFKYQLRSIIDETHDWLFNVMSIEERKKFLEPLYSLLDDSRIINHMKGNIGVFRNMDSFRLLNIPIEIEKSCQVASSYHVKPLLRWLQGDEDFLLLGIESELVHLYYGSQSSFKRLNTLVMSELVASDKEYRSNKKSQKSDNLKPTGEDDFYLIKKRIVEITRHAKPKLFFAGDFEVIKKIQKKMNYKNMVKTPLVDSFQNRDSVELCTAIRNILKTQSRLNLEKSLLEFKIAEEGNRAQKNIFQISKAVVQGRVRKLIETEEMNIFGKINTKTGGLAIHPFDLDHEDDCILDDLAQMVLSQGGEVIVAKKNEIPNGRPILAILDDDDVSLETAKELINDGIHEKSI